MSVAILFLGVFASAGIYFGCKYLLSLTVAYHVAHTLGVGEGMGSVRGIGSMIREGMPWPTTGANH